MCRHEALGKETTATQTKIHVAQEVFMDLVLKAGLCKHMYVPEIVQKLHCRVKFFSNDISSYFSEMKFCQ